MTFDLQSKEFWDASALDKELRRVFDVCHGCRRCFNLCPSFSSLFDLIDGRGEDVNNLTPADITTVVALCYQCKLCYNHCPYTPPHYWRIDFPRLMLRAKAVGAKREGVPLQDKILGRPDQIGRMGRMLAPLINVANRMKPFRLLLEKVVGIHRDRTLPIYHRETFADWFRRQSRQRLHRGEKRDVKVALFYTCSVNYNDPAVGRATVAVLQRNGIEVIVPEQKCCGMPALDGGDVALALDHVAYNVERLAEVVHQGYDIVIPGPTCSYMLKREYPLLLPTEEARRVAEHSFDICEYLMRRYEQGQLDTAFQTMTQRIAYHVPCHLRAQNIGYKSRDLLRLIPGTSVRVIEQCSAVDGTWGLKKEYYPLSLKVASKLFREIETTPPDIVVSDCPLAALQIVQGTKRKPLHPIQVLARAYGIESE